MKKKGIAVLAVLCGLACAGCVLLYTQHVEARAALQRSEALERFGGDQVEVCVATRTIAAGETVDTSNVTTRLWLVDLLPEDPVMSLSEVAGVQASAPLVAGEVLVHARFDESHAAVALPAGLQAVGIELGVAQAVGGSLQVGNIVDVYASGASGTARIAENVLVASVMEGGSGRVAITLAVPPDRVEELIAATQAATLYLTLPAGQEEQGEGD